MGVNIFTSGDIDPIINQSAFLYVRLIANRAPKGGAMSDFYVLRDPVPNQYQIYGFFSDVGKKKIRDLKGIRSVNKTARDPGIIVITDGEVKFSDLFPQITTLAQAH